MAAFILINYAIVLAPILSHVPVFHVSLHPDIFKDHDQLELPNVNLVLPRWAKEHATADAATRFY